MVDLAHHWLSAVHRAQELEDQPALHATTNDCHNYLHECIQPIDSTEASLKLGSSSCSCPQAQRQKLINAHNINQL